MKWCNLDISRLFAAFDNYLVLQLAVELLVGGVDSHAPPKPPDNDLDKVGKSMSPPNLSDWHVSSCSGEVEDTEAVFRDRDLRLDPDRAGALLPSCGHFAATAPQRKWLKNSQEIKERMYSSNSIMTNVVFIFSLHSSFSVTLCCTAYIWKTFYVPLNS